MTQQRVHTAEQPVIYHSPLTDYDVHLFKEGRHYHLYEKLGAHPMVKDGARGTHFAVWAPNAASVSVIGDFNGWNRTAHQLSVRWDHSGVWEGFVPNVDKGAVYKYHIVSRAQSFTVDKGDPYGFAWENAPRTASIVADLHYEWGDDAWMQRRYKHNNLHAPWSVYELHLGSWRRVPEEENRPMTYREIAPHLTQYVMEMGFTHVELLPVMEHPFYGSWGYQSVGYFAPTSRYGSPRDFMYLIDCLHQCGIGVILDWVPSHFPSDEHGLVYFDGTHLYEHADPRQGFHPDWETYIFNYGRLEVQEFLISSALFWLSKYHIDGLRVDAVASMLYLDYSRQQGQWIPNDQGGRENVEAIDFLRKLNETVYGVFPDTQMIAEESTAWPMVSKPVYTGGLGFGMKWNMGWMHDTLDYFAKDPVYRKYHQSQLLFSLWYAFTENFMLPLSHDEVVYGKRSLLGKMPGDDWQKRANLRILLGYMFAHPGKKLLFMGGEFGQWNEWRHDTSLDWHLLQESSHEGLRRWTADCNRLYKEEAALHEEDFSREGFSWIDCNDSEKSVLSFLRYSRNRRENCMFICNLTPTPRYNYRIGAPHRGYWRELLNSDASEYGGSGMGNEGGVETSPIACHNSFHSLSLLLPPLSMLVLKNERPD